MSHHFDCQCCGMPDSADIISDEGVVLGPLCPHCAYYAAQLPPSVMRAELRGCLFGVVIGAVVTVLFVVSLFWAGRY